MNFWQTAISYVHQANNLFGDFEPHKRPVQCYIGKRLIPAGPAYQVIILPRDDKGKEVGRKITYVTESGTGMYWGEENVAMRHSARVQDRSRVVSRTKIRYDFEGAVVSALSLQGKIISIFFLWFVSLVVIGVAVFTFELLYFKCEKMCANVILKFLILNKLNLS